jgi:predicted DNA-binding protein
VTEQTSVRVSVQTRDELNKLAAERGITADRALAEAIAAVREEEWRRHAEEESRRLSHDPTYKAELADLARFFGDD